MDTIQAADRSLPYRYVVVKRNRKGAVVGPRAYYDSSNVLLRRTAFKSGQLNGMDTWYYPNGRIRLEMPNDKGEFHGVIKSYHRNGRIEVYKPYKRGKLDGERVIRDSTGALVNGDYTEVLPYDSVLIRSHCVNGRPDGPVVVTRYGKKVLEGNCTNGRPEGGFLTYDANGKAIRRDVYEKGRFVRSENVY